MHLNPSHCVYVHLWRQTVHFNCCIIHALGQGSGRPPGSRNYSLLGCKRKLRKRFFLTILQRTFGEKNKDPVQTSYRRCSLSEVKKQNCRGVLCMAVTVMVDACMCLGWRKPYSVNRELLPKWVEGNTVIRVRQIETLGVLFCHLCRTNLSNVDRNAIEALCVNFITLYFSITAWIKLLFRFLLQ